MKRSFKGLNILMLIMVYGINSNAQNLKPSDGIFLTEQDYLSNHISYSLDPKLNDRLQLNEFFAGKNICVLCKGKSVKLLKNCIYGYRQNGENFRFFNNEAYKIIDTIGFPLYSRQRLNQLSNKGWLPVERYFFSVDPGKPIFNLTVENLYNSFPGQPSFRYSIENFFSNDRDLKSYDKLSHMFKIKYFYLQQQGKLTHAAF